MIWKNKRVLVTGSEGLIGKELVEQLIKLKAKVYRFDLKLGHEILDIEQCINSCKEVNYVFHLFGIKGNPKMTKEKPVKFMFPMLIGDSNMIMASKLENIKRFLYTSSIAVENPESDKYQLGQNKQQKL